jgi:hypothetical protein
MPLERIVPRKRRTAAANDRLSIMPGGRLQVPHGVAFPMKGLVAPSCPTLPQPHVDPLDALGLAAFFLDDRSRVRTTSRLRHASGWAGRRVSLCAALPLRVGLVRALDHLLGVPGSSRTNTRGSSSLRSPRFIFRRLPHIRRHTVDLVILRSPLGDDLVGPTFGPSDPVPTSEVGVIASGVQRP